MLSLLSFIFISTSESVNVFTCRNCILGDDNITSYIIPVCQCVGLDEGILCERHVNSPCDATTYDPRTPGKIMIKRF